MLFRSDTACSEEIGTITARLRVLRRELKLCARIEGDIDVYKRQQLNYPIPVLIERVDEDDAQIQCVDGNLHRKDIPLSELARAAQMKMDALKRKAGRRSKADILAGKEPMKRSDEQVGEDLGMSRASVQRLMRVNQLEEPLKKMVDKLSLIHILHI